MRGGAFAFWVNGLRSTATLFLLCSLLAPVLAYGQVTPPDEYAKLIRSAQDVAALGKHPFGEHVNLYNGELSFEVTDISVPGTGPTLQVARSFEVGSSGLYDNVNREMPFGDWDLDIPRIETYAPQQGGWQVESTGDLNRCTQFNAPPPIANAQGGGTWTPGMWWYGYHLIVPGAGNQILLGRMPSNTHSPTISGKSFGIVTKQDWMITCGVTASDGGEGFLAYAPDGTQYTFSHLVYRPISAVGAPLGSTATTAGAVQPMVATDMIIQRWQALMYVTKVVDRFGNTLTYNWSGNNLQSIVASDGRELEFTYNASNPQLIQTITLEAAGGAPARTWTYGYTTSSTAPPTLASVKLPDGHAWSYSLGSLQMAAYSATYQNDLCPGSGDLEIGTGTSNTTDTGSITAPSGLTGTFTVAPMLHARSYVPLMCIGLPGSSSGQGYPAIPDQYAQFSLTQEVLTGPGIPTETWKYSYAPPVPSWSSDSCASSNSCAATVYTDVTDPDGYETVYTFSNRFDITEGELLSTSFYSGGSGSGVIRSVANTYADPTGGPWPTSYGIAFQSHTNHDQIEELSPLKTRVTNQDGATFTTSINSFDDFARATSTTESSSLGYSKTDTTSYQDDTNLWVLGLTTGTATNGISSSAATYDSHDLPYQEYAFGRLVSTKAWNDADGTLTSVADGDGNVTSFSNWYRGLPGTITFADGSSESATINGDGWITALTDENGFTTDYDYDPMGRLTEISYPAGDDVAWNPTYLSFAPAGAEFGIPAGHWRQTVRTGNDYKVTDFDAFWRPLVTEHYDPTDANVTPTEVVNQYDADGRTIFTSYPTDGVTSYTQSLLGTSTSYDALDRVTEIEQDSSLGKLPTTTQYLTGFRTEVTDPKDNSTTTSYQAYGTPTTEWPVSIIAPQGETTTIARDVFGKPISITRAGTSFARDFTYNAYQELCGRTDPETGTTAYGYDLAGNLVWSASGLAPASGSCYSEPGNAVTRTYTPRNWLKTITYPDGFSSASYTYAPDGAMLTASMVNDGVSTAYTYDKRRLLTSEALSIPNSSTATLTYEHDANGHLNETIYPDGRAIFYAPNALGQPTEAGSYATGVQYYPSGAIASFTFGNGIVHAMQQTERQFVGSATDTYNGTTFRNDVYAYDGDGNLAGITDNVSSTGNVTMSYDGLDRLTQAVSLMFGAGSEDVANYNYDVLNNLTSAQVGGQSFDYSYNSNNQLAALTDPSTGSPLVSYTYDAQGNLASKNGQAFQFDTANRLKAVPNVASYLYDAAGRRVQKVEVENGLTLDSDYSRAGQLMYQFNPANVDATDYIYLGSTLVARVVGNNSNVIGNIDGVSTANPPVLMGWACSTGISSPITVQVYVGGPMGGGGTLMTTATADQSSEPAVASSCNNTGSDYRFDITISSAEETEYGGDPIYVYGVSPVGNGNNALSGSGTYSVPTNPNAPLPPASISVPSSSTTGSITVSWASSSTATSYILQQQFNGGAWTQVYDSSGTSTAISGLAAGSYVYRVRACNSYGCGGYTTSGTLTVTPPAAPASITVPGTTNSASFTVSWQASAGATNYILQENPGTGWSQIYSGSALSYAVTVAGSGHYQFEVEACSAVGCSAFTASGSVAVIPLAPASITVPASSYSASFAVSWQASAMATNYVLYENPNGAGWGELFSGDVTSTTVTVSASGTYQYEVAACGAGGCSGFTASGNVAVTLPPGSAPTLSGPSSSTNGSFTLSWNTISGATRYQLNQNLSGTLTVPYNAGGTSWSSSNLANGTYNYQVFACNVAGCGPGSNGVAVSVLHVPAAPASVTAPSSVPYPGNRWSISIAASSGASSYNLRRTNTGTGAATVMDGVGTSTTDYTTPGTYQYAAQACNASGCSGWRNAGNTTNVFCAETMTAAKQGGINPDVLKCGGSL